MPKKLSRANKTMPVSSIMGSGRGGLAHIYDKVQLLEQLQEVLYSLWPELKEAKVRPVSIQRGTLTLSTPLAGSAVRIRHALPEITHSLQQESLLEHLKLEKIKILHHPERPAPPPAPPVVKPPSAPMLEEMAAASETYQSPRLKQAFSKLLLSLKKLNSR